MKRRFKEQILGSILEVCSNKGVTKTKVVYTSGMNFSTIQPYLDLLTNDGLIEIIDGRPIKYRTTKKGGEALNYIRALETLMPGLKSFGPIG